MATVIADCIQCEQVCYKCVYRENCKYLQRKGMAKPYQYVHSEDIKKKYLEDLVG